MLCFHLRNHDLFLFFFSKIVCYNFFFLPSYSFFVYVLLQIVCMLLFLASVLIAVGMALPNHS